MPECTTAPARVHNARRRNQPEPVAEVAPEPPRSPYDTVAAMGSQIEDGFDMLVDGTTVSASSPTDVTIDFVRRHLRDALWNFSSPDIHTINDGATAWFDQLTLALEPVPSVLDVVVVAARETAPAMKLKAIQDLKAMIEGMSLELTQWDAATLKQAFREVTEDQAHAEPLSLPSTAQSGASTGIKKRDTLADMQEGVDLALRMMRACEAYEDSQLCEGERWVRGGQPQVRFARDYLQELIAKPQLLEGFAAVLSATLAAGMSGKYAALNFDLPAAEFQPGVPGEDGTRASPDDEPGDADHAEEACAPQPTPAPKITWDTHLSQGGPAARSILAEAAFATHHLCENASSLLSVVWFEDGLEAQKAAYTLGALLRRIEDIAHVVATYGIGDDYDEITLGGAYDRITIGPAHPKSRPQLTPDGQLVPNGRLYV